MTTTSRKKHPKPKITVEEELFITEQVTELGFFEVGGEEVTEEEYIRAMKEFGRAMRDGKSYHGQCWTYPVSLLNGLTVTVFLGPEDTIAGVAFYDEDGTLSVRSPEAIEANKALHEFFSGQ